MPSPPRRYNSAFPLCTVTDSGSIAQRTDSAAGDGNAATHSCDVPKAVRKPHRLLAHVPARLHHKRHKLKSSTIWHILPEPRPLGLFSPRRSPPSCLGSLSRVRLRRHMRNHDIHCRKLVPRQHRHDVAPALAFDHALLSGQGTATRLRR